MEKEIVVAIIAASVTAFGWLVTFIFQKRSDRQRHELIARLEHTERQLEELYGPLYFLILEGKQSFKECLEILGRRLGQSVFPLSKEEVPIWLFWVENDFMPRNAQIRILLMSKTHLVDGASMPQSFLDFLDHQFSWDIHHRLLKERGVEYSLHSTSNWPRKFDEEVIEGFLTLKSRHANLLGRASRSLGKTILSALVPAVARDVGRLFREGLRLREEGEEQKAQEAWASAIRLAQIKETGAPDAAQAALMMGLSLLKQGKKEEAIKALKGAISISQSNPESSRIAAMASILICKAREGEDEQKDDLERALMFCETSDTADDMLDAAQVSLILAQFFNKNASDQKQALKFYKKVETFAEKQAHKLGTSNLTDEAIKLVQRATSEAGQIYMKSKRFDLGCDSIIKGIKLAQKIWSGEQKANTASTLLALGKACRAEKSTKVIEVLEIAEELGKASGTKKGLSVADEAVSLLESLNRSE